MNIEEIENVELKQKFREVMSLPDLVLARIGVPAELRDKCIDGLLLPPPGSNSHWLWSGSHFGKGIKRRALVTHKDERYLVYRVIMALLLHKHVRHELGDINHKCEPEHFPACCCPEHLAEGSKLENAQDRVKARSLHGDHNGSRTKPESRPRGFNNARSFFREKDKLLIQQIRATYENHKETKGIFVILHELFKVPVNSLTRLVRRYSYPEIPDDSSVSYDTKKFAKFVANRENRVGFSNFRHPRTKFGPKDKVVIQKIRNTYMANQNLPAITAILAELFGTTKEVIVGIVKEQTFRYVPRNPKPVYNQLKLLSYVKKRDTRSRPSGFNHHLAKFKPGDEKLIQTIRATYDVYKSTHGIFSILAEIYKTTWGAIRGVALRQTFKDLPNNPTLAMSENEFARFVETRKLKRKHK